MSHILLKEIIVTDEGILNKIVNSTACVVGLFLGSTNNGNAETWTYCGKSMSPAMPAASEYEPKKIEIEKLSWNKLEIGMVAVYKHKTGYYIIHRLFKQISPNEWWVKGDNNHSPDNDYVTPKNYVGVVKNVPPKHK